MPHLGILSYSIASDLEPSVREWCIQQWQTYQPGTKFDDTISRHKLWPTLEFCLRQNGLWEHLPPVLQQRLQKTRQEYALRQLQLLSQLEELDTALTARGLAGILLKGSALLFHPIYPSLGDRGTADIDIAVSLAEIPAFVEVLNSLNYATENPILPEINNRTHHLPEFFRSDSLKIEVHPLSTFDGITQQFSQEIATTAEHPEGFTALKVPTPTELFWHIAWHGWFNHPQLRNILDLYRLESLYPVDLDTLTLRAREYNLGDYWSCLLEQMNAMVAGKSTKATIHRWEWQPTVSRHGYEMYLPERCVQQNWQNLFSSYSRIKHPLFRIVLYPAILPVRLSYVGSIYAEWLLSQLRFSRFTPLSPPA